MRSLKTLPMSNLSWWPGVALFFFSFFFPHQIIWNESSIPMGYWNQSHIESGERRWGPSLATRLRPYVFTKSYRIEDESKIFLRLQSGKSQHPTPYKKKKKKRGRRSWKKATPTLCWLWSTLKASAYGFRPRPYSGLSKVTPTPGVQVRGVARSKSFSYYLFCRAWLRPPLTAFKLILFPNSALSITTISRRLWLHNLHGISLPRPSFVTIFRLCSMDHVTYVTFLGF